MEPLHGSAGPFSGLKRGSEDVMWGSYVLLEFPKSEVIPGDCPGEFPFAEEEQELSMVECEFFEHAAVAQTTPPLSPQYRSSSPPSPASLTPPSPSSDSDGDGGYFSPQVLVVDDSTTSAGSTLSDAGYCTQSPGPSDIDLDLEEARAPPTRVRKVRAKKSSINREGYCPHCVGKDANFFHRRLDRHVIRKHGDRKFPCELCLKEFNQFLHLERHLQTHKETHDASKKFTCLCGKVLSRKDKFKEHVKKFGCIESVSVVSG